MKDELVFKAVKFNRYKTVEDGKEVEKSYGKNVGGVYKKSKDGNLYVKLDTLHGTVFIDLFPSEEEEKVEVVKQEVKKESTVNW